MRFAVHDLIQAKWTDRIHDEWMAAVLRERPDLTRVQLERTRQLMDRHAGDCLVVGFEQHIESLVLPDENDRHVLAAAVASEAEAVVTWNVSDFCGPSLDALAIEVWTPDDLLLKLLNHDLASVLEVMREHRASLKNPVRSAEEYLETLFRQGLVRSVALVKAKGEI